MSRILEAQCDAEGKVTCQGYHIKTAKLLTAGKQASTGIIVVDGLNVVYLTSNTTDLATTLEKLTAALNKAVTALNQAASGMQSIDNKPTGGTGSAPVPVAAGNISQIQSAASDISSLSSELAELKGALK